jgi:DNA-binding protein HU-beta
MSKTEFVAQIATNLGTTKVEAQKMYEMFFDTLLASIKADGKFTVQGFGTFNLKTRAARIARNPKTGEPVKVKASKALTFKMSHSLKETL